MSEQVLTKIDSHSADYKALAEFHRSGKSSTFTPKIFYESELGAPYKAKYSFKALQNAWHNSKRLVAQKVSQIKKESAAAAGGKLTLVRVVLF